MKKMKIPTQYFLAAILSLTALIFSSCADEEYASPQPGVLEIHVRTISEGIPFTEKNNFILKVIDVIALRNDGDLALIYEDNKAIGRTSTAYNVVQPKARDSALIIGQAYAPPGNYAGAYLQLQPGNQVVLDGYRFIGVYTLEGFNSFLFFPKNYPVIEGKTTIVTLTIDLDKSLVKADHYFIFIPYYYISSVRVI